MINFNKEDLKETVLFIAVSFMVFAPVIFAIYKGILF